MRFYPAVLALGNDVHRAAELQESSYRMWNVAGIEPETLDYAKMQITSPGYELRPEIIESTYYLYHYTHDAKYLAMGRTYLDGLVKYCRTDEAYAALADVRTQGEEGFDGELLLCRDAEVSLSAVCAGVDAGV